MTSKVVFDYFQAALKENEEKHLRLMEMLEYITSHRKYPKLMVRGEELVLNKRYLNRLSRREMGARNNKLLKIFKTAVGKNHVRFSPFILNSSAREFFLQIRETLGKYQGEYIIDRLRMLWKYSIIEQTILDRLISLYIKKSKIFIPASQNKKRKENGEGYSRHYISPNDLMRKYLRPSLESVVASFQGKVPDFDKGNFRDDVLDVDHLLDFKLYNSGTLRKGMTEENPDPKVREMIQAPQNNKVIKEYLKQVQEAQIKSSIQEEEHLPPETFIQIAAKVSEIQFKGENKEEYQLGPYTPEQIKELEVAPGDALRLAVRANLDTEKLSTKLIKE